MNLDLEQIMILLQRRYRAFQEISRLTSELGEAVSRRDEVSASLLLEMRADEISVVDTCYRKKVLAGSSLRYPSADYVRSRRRPSVR